MKRTQILVLVLLFAAGLFFGQAVGNYMIKRLSAPTPNSRAVYVRPIVPVYVPNIEEDIEHSCYVADMMSYRDP